MESKKVWLVTGASKGLGQTLVKALLAQRYQVAATSRNYESLVEAIGHHDDFLPIELDITDDPEVDKAVRRVRDRFGRIDVVVNNAGYGQIGTLEELSDAEVRKNYDVNVFGSLNIIRHTTPLLRQQKSGHIFNIASVGGLVGSFPAFGIYCSTKFAVAGFTEALAVEMEDFGVHTTLVYPGYFRTEFLSKGSVQTAKKPIKAYLAARESEAAHLDQINGNQPNDPEKAAQLLIRLSKLEKPPVHFFMGEDAYEMAKKKIETLSEEAEKWKDLSVSTAY